MIHELRHYECVPGMLPIVLKRFEDHAFPIWNELGIRSLGFWTTAIGENDQSLHYILAWECLADREAKWHAFAADPRWQLAKKLSEPAGPLVARIRNSILKPVLQGTTT
ncbi:NIPSNAP family protein [Aminobacter sp. AP02]|uniref:NIPSNAP family protein n=1 Tax=Aminobacter sp. AP02 TaxID=2135737 RepID=UPI000D6C7F7B|nr:NIPSNAP family protein [Aminobacter sp. AP02]PWK59428.1 NIPSNAP protein [Aminobacter sp. AP02]